jgi:hypothetical protein
MDEDIAKENHRLFTFPNTNGPLLCRQKIHIENQMHPETLSWTMALLHMI